MAFTGRHERLSAQRAYELGICSQLVAPDDLEAQAQVLGELIARNSPAALEHTKRALWRALEEVGR
jgi:enoyl-CoA hydratase/carnithine racemase